MSTKSTDTLYALVGLISSSLNEVISAYHVAGHDVPSLDSVEPGPFDSPQSMPFHVRKAIQIIEGACAQLCATIASPGHSTLNVRPTHTVSPKHID